ncbi:MAG: sodium:solute symporter family protein [Clostridium sp.]|nr:sodium:solute symporter family protein [Clostridium sp.]
MHDLTTLDLAIIIFYMIGMLIVGVWFVKRIKNTGDYYVAGRTLGPFVLTATVCASIIGGSAMMGRAGVAYTTGFKAVMTAIPYLLGMFIFSAIAGRIQDVGKRRNVNSIPELFHLRFSREARCILALMIVFTMMGTVAAQVTATATIIKMLGAEFGISYEAGAFVATVIFIIYTAASGLFGVVYTDVLQFFMLIIFVYMLIPISSLRFMGGFSVFWQNLDKSYLVPHIDGSILGDIVTYLVFTLAGAEMWQRAFAAKSRKAATQGMFWGTSVYMFTIALVFFMGLAARQILPNVTAEYGSSDAVVPALAISILPPGLTGLALAGILSVMMSTADSYLLVSVQTFVHDLGKNFLPEMTEKHEIFMSRVMSVVLAMGALIIALYIKNAYNVLMFAWSFYAAAAGLPSLAALYWKKATNAGILAAMIGGFTVCVGWKLAGNPLGLGETVPGAVVCGILLVAVSLATYKSHPCELA